RRRPFLRRGDQPLLAHQPKDNVTALERAFVVRPRREGRRRPNQAGNERGFRQRHRARRLSKQMLGHRLDAIHAGAQIDAVQIKLEDLFLGELRLDEDRETGLFELADVALDVGQKQRAGELLGQCAAALGAAAVTKIARQRAAEPDRIDARMVVEPAILDGDDRVLKVGRDLVERNVMTLLVEPEPRLTVGAVEHRVADAARQPVHRRGVAQQPHGRDAAREGENRKKPQRQPIDGTPRREQVQDRCPLLSAMSEYASAIAKITTIRPSDSHFGISKATYPPACRYSTNSLTPTQAMMTNAPSTSAGYRSTSARSCPITSRIITI